jgi:cobalt/nickel transport system permease protein
MHIPDGFINGATSLGAGVVAVGGVGAALRSGGRSLEDRQIPMAGLSAAFIFVLQMLNFPVAAGTSGHLIGGALAVILLGPALGITALAVVVVMQALLFADGGISALGLNVFNMAILAGLAGWVVFRALMAVLPKRIPALLAASMVAAWASVVVSSLGFVAQYSLGGRGLVDLDKVLSAMVGVHALIGIGEGIITATVIGAVMAVRPDVVRAARHYRIARSKEAAPSRKAMTVFTAVGLAAALVLVVFVAPLASPDPDGLERVAIDAGFNETAEDSPVAGPLADYGLEGVADDRIGTIAAGVIGLVVTFAAGLVLVSTTRRRRRHTDRVSLH